MTRRHLLIALAALAALVVAHLAGRHGARVPDSTTQEKATERVEARVVEVFTGAEEWVTRREAVTDTHQVSVVERGPSRITHPDGTVEERGAERAFSQTHTQTRTDEDTRGTRTVEVERIVEVEVVREVERRVEIRTPAPDWLLSAHVGAGSVGVLYGGQVARRVLGPLHLTAGAMAGGGEWVVMGGVGVSWP